MLILQPEIKKHFATFDDLMHVKGEVFRALENRCTQRFVLDGHAYFIKQHFGVGWKEIFKNLVQLRLPVISAKNEWQAIKKLHGLGLLVPEVLGYGYRGVNPAHIQSFLVTRELPPHITLEDFCKNWRTSPPSVQLKRDLIKAVARIARALHENGVNHRDFYICHFLLTQPVQKLQLYLIDLHRAQIRKQVPMRWLIKDLAGLYFSSKEIGLTQRDLLRFIKEYRKNSLSNVLNKEMVFWQKVKKRGDQLYQEHTSQYDTRN